MKTALTIYVSFCLICPMFNEEPIQPVKEEVKEVAFWCDCGSSQHWKDGMMSDI